jgi:hypothetical protein
MAFVICERHGGHVAPLLCSHLDDAVRRRLTLPDVFYVEAWYLDEPAWSHHICLACAHANGIAESRTIWRDDDALDRLFGMKCDVAPVCPICFNEARNSRPTCRCT